MFVVDSNDQVRISDAADELQRFLSEDGWKDCILLVLANKQDLANAMSVEEVTEKMKLNSLRNRNWCKYLHNCKLHDYIVAAKCITKV